MHDLNTINKLNYDAWASGIGEQQRLGRYVTAEYHGATLVSIYNYGTGGEALTKYAELRARRGESIHAKLFFPPGGDAGAAAAAHALAMADRNTSVEEVFEGSTPD